MDKAKFIAEIGSCWGGDRLIGFRMMEEIKRAGFRAAKFQLFPNEERFTASGNIHLPHDLYLEFAEYAKLLDLPITASVFDENSLDFLLKQKPPFIKFAYSQKDKNAWIEKCTAQGIETIVSCDVMTRHLVPKESKKLFCLPRYPVYEVIDFTALFPLFDGFSDHTLGIGQTVRAISSGATIIEKHVKLNDDFLNVPDAHFSVTINEMARFISNIQGAD